MDSAVFKMGVRQIATPIVVVITGIMEFVRQFLLAEPKVVEIWARVVVLGLALLVEENPIVIVTTNVEAHQSAV